MRALLFILITYVSFSGILPIKIQAQTKNKNAQVWASNTLWIKQLKIPPQDTFYLKQVIDSLIQVQIWQEGHYTCVLDSVYQDSSQTHIYLSDKKSEIYVKLKSGNLPSIWLPKGSLEVQKNPPALWLQKLQEHVVKIQENQGYPFAQIRLDSLHWTHDTLLGSLNLDRQGLYRIDSIHLTGNVKINPLYVHQYLEIKPGDVYQESKITGIESKISEWSFAKLKNPVKVKFVPGGSHIFIPLEKKRASSFYGIVGILPDQEGRINITGEARIRLENSLGRADLFKLEWKRIQNNTQNLKTQMLYPYVLNMPLALAFDLDLFRKDTSFSNVQLNYGLHYLLSAKNYVKIFIAQKRSNLLSTRGALVETQQYLDAKSLLYGLGLHQQTLDYIYNPSKGWLIDISGTVGSKTLPKNPRLPDQTYDSIALKTQDYTVQYQTQWYQKIRGRLVLKLSSQGQYILNENLFENEFPRIGGLFTLRGFDEESIYASSYSISTLEPRFLLEKNSFLYVFTDMAYFENKTKNRHIYGKPLSFGTGISFETKTGIFTFSYALGNLIYYENGLRKDSGFLIRSGKVHFGFVSFF